MDGFEKTRDGWKKLGRVAPEELAETRRQLHWAAQIASAVGTTLLTARDDDSQTNFEWLEDLKALAGEPVGDERNLRAAIRPEDLTLLLIGGGRQILSSFGLIGKRYGDGMSWMNYVLEDGLGHPLPRPLRRRNLDLPPHPTDENGAQQYDASGERLGEISRWFSNADLLQRDLTNRTEHASPVRCWPHHFDHAMLISLEPSRGYAGRTIGLGLSPGDMNYEEPYWYVNPYPAPASAPLPSLAAGHWHTEGWTGIVLTGSEIVSRESPAAQSDLCTTYLSSALEACRTVIGA